MRGRRSNGTAFAAVLCVLIALALAGLAGAEGPVTVPVENLELTFNAGFSPKVLSKTVPTPIALKFSAQIKTVDGTHPPALREFILDADKHGAIDVKGLPVCRPRPLEDRGTVLINEACKNSIIGEGMMNVDIEFAESTPFLVKSALTIFNGGIKHGVTTLLIYAFLKTPVPAAVVSFVKLRKIHKGRFGTEGVVSFPVIAGGSGSVTSFSATLNRRFSYKGKRASLLTLRCSDSKIQARAEAIFGDGTHVKAGILHPCTSKG